MPLEGQYKATMDKIDQTLCVHAKAVRGRGATGERLPGLNTREFAMAVKQQRRFRRRAKGCWTACRWAA